MKRRGHTGASRAGVATERDPPAWEAAILAEVAQERDPPAWRAAILAAVAQERAPPAWGAAILAVAGGLQLHHSLRCGRIPTWQKGIPRTAPNICLRGIAVLKYGIGFSGKRVALA